MNETIEHMIDIVRQEEQSLSVRDLPAGLRALLALHGERLEELTWTVHTHRAWGSEGRNGVRGNWGVSRRNAVGARWRLLGDWPESPWSDCGELTDAELIDAVAMSLFAAEDAPRRLYSAAHLSSTGKSSMYSALAPRQMEHAVRNLMKRTLMGFWINE